MLKRAGIVQAATFGGLSFIALSASAQDPQGGIQMVFGVEHEFQAGDNLSLDIPGAGSTNLSTTNLSFDLLSRTRTQELSFSAGGKLRAGEIPSSSDIDTGFVEPQVTLSYSRNAARANFSVDADFRQNDVSFGLPLSSFTDPLTGELLLPPDFEDLRGSGTREAFRTSTRLETGIDAPIGFIFDASVSGINYSDTSSANLNDVFRYSTGVQSRLRLSPVTTGVVGFELDHFEADDTMNTERDTYTVEVGVEQQISSRASLEAFFGFSETEEELSGVKSTRDGAVGRLVYELDLRSGSINAEFETTRDEDGPRHFLTFGQSINQPLGVLSYEIGATSLDGNDPDLIGGVNWQRQMPTGSVNFGVRRNVTQNLNNEDRVATILDFRYEHTINALSSLGFDVAFGVSENTATSNETRRTDVSATYRYALTRDWNLTTGVSYRTRDEDLVGSADSTSVFVRVGRDFNFLQ